MKWYLFVFSGNHHSVGECQEAAAGVISLRNARLSSF
jgi:hypothetical protein